MADFTKLVNLGRLETFLDQIKSLLAAKADKSSTITNVVYDSTNKKFTKTINGKTTDITTVAVIKTALSLSKSDVGLSNVENKSSATIRGELTKENVTSALGYTPPSSDTTYSAMSVEEAEAGIANTSRTITASVLNSAITSKGYTTNVGTVTGIKMNGASKGSSGEIDLGTVITSHQDISGKANKSETVSTIIYDTTNKKLTKTINGTTSDVVKVSTLKSDMGLSKSDVGLGNVENKSSATIRGELTKANVTSALGTGTGTTKYLREDGSWATPPNDNTTYFAGSGLSLSGTTLNHSNSVTAQNTQAIYPIKIDAQGHISAYGSAVTPLTSSSTLNASKLNGTIPTSCLPSYVDDVLEYESNNDFPSTGEAGKIYVNTNTNLTYRWSGTAYVEISPSIALGETSSTAYRGDRGKTAYDHSQSAHARTDATAVVASSTNGNIKINGTETTVYTHPSGTNPHGTTKSDVGLGNVGNFKAVSTVASQGLTDTEKSNARSNIGAGTSSLTLGTGSGNAYRGDYGNTAYSHATDSSKLTTAKSSGLYKIATTAQGHIASVTAVEKADITALGIPGSNTDTHYTSKNVVGSSTATSNTTTALTNGNVYLNSVENGSVTSAHKISGSGAATVTTDSSGNIVINSTNTTYSSKTAASGGTDVSLVTTGEKYTWNNKSNLAIGTTSTTAAAGDHSHTVSLATDNGTSSISLKANTKYKLTAGGSTYVFTTPPDTNTNTHRPIQVNGTEVLGDNTTAFNLKAGTNISLSNSNGTVTITSTDTNTWRGIQNNLTSTSTSDSLSANQGRILNENKVDKTEPTYSIDKTASSGTEDGNLYAALSSLGWTNVVD